MKDFFATMNFVRAVMLICFVGAAVLGFLSKEAQAKKDVLLAQVVGENSYAAKAAGRIQQLAVEIDQLQKVSAGFSYEELENAGAYARGLAARKDVSLGDITVGQPTEKSNVPGSVDKAWNLSPKDSKRPYTRGEISNFFYILEVDNPFVIVTECSFKPDNKSKDDEYADDRWTFKAKITSRRPDN